MGEKIAYVFSPGSPDMKPAVSAAGFVFSASESLNAVNMTYSQRLGNAARLLSPISLNQLLTIAAHRSVNWLSWH